MDITLTVAEYNAATRPFAPGDVVTISDTQSKVSLLSVQTIAQMSADNVDFLNSQSGLINLMGLATVAALAASNIQFAPGNAVTLFLRMAELQTLTPEQLSSLVAKGLDSIRSFDQAKQIYNVAQFKAIGGVELYATDEINVIDTGINIGTLTLAEIAKLDKVDATDNLLVLSISQLNALGFVRIPADDAIIVRDTGANISALTPAQIASLSERVSLLNATDNNITISTAQYIAMQSALKFGVDDIVTIADTGASFQNLSQANFTQMIGRGIGILRATDGDLVLAAPRLLALLGTGITLAATGNVVLADSAASIQALTTQQITDLSAKGVKKFDVTDTNLTLSIQQAAALAGTSISFMAGDTVTVTGNAGDFATLVDAPQIAALAAKGVTLFDSTDDRMFFTLAEFNALSQIGLAAGDAVFLHDSRAAFQALSVQQLASFVAKGVDFIHALENDIALTVAQFRALGTVGVIGTDTFALTDTGANLGALSVVELVALGG